MTRTLAMVAGAAITGALAGASSLCAQLATHAGISWSVGAIPIATHAAPAMAGRSATEAYLTQPLAMLHLRGWGGRVLFAGTLDLEGVTLRRGELNAGMWGEGYVDRRHPHTYLHEAVVTVAPRQKSDLAASITVGRGSVPFGTDDPMVRPFVKYPANHHLAQILERYLAVGAVRAGPVTLEGALFNGNEPTGPTELRGVGRMGDSRALRGTLRPSGYLETQASFATVASPDLPPSAESAHRKWSASVRTERPLSGASTVYALAEWARTDATFSGVLAHRLESVLGEVALATSRFEVALRWERTSRPEEERLLDPFRTPVPHADIHLLGMTRWRITSARAELGEVGIARSRIEPFLEASHAQVQPVTPNQLFDPIAFYGSDRMWSVSLGVRLGLGEEHPRMGRYGVAGSSASGDDIHVGHAQ